MFISIMGTMDLSSDCLANGSWRSSGSELMKWFLRENQVIVRDTGSMFRKSSGPHQADIEKNPDLKVVDPGRPHTLQSQQDASWLRFMTCCLVPVRTNLQIDPCL